MLGYAIFFINIGSVLLQYGPFWWSSYFVSYNNLKFHPRPFRLQVGMDESALNKLSEDDLQFLFVL